MAPLPQVYRGFTEKLLQGDFDLLTVDLYVRLYASTLDAADRNVDAVPTALGTTTGQVLSVAIPTGDRSLSWDPDTRDVVLGVDPPVSTGALGSPITFRYGLIVADDGVDEWAVVLIDFEEDTVLAAGTHDLAMASLLQMRLFTALQPAPIGADIDPLNLVDTDDQAWRVFSDDTGTMVVTTTSEVVDEPDKWLTAPDASTWKLVVSMAGVVTATSGTPVGGDEVYDTVTPLLVPSNDPALIFELTVSNTGVLSLVAA